MMSTRYQNLFQSLQQKSEGAFIPFVTLADPDLATSERIIEQLIESGADALELGLPFSDPIADGPIIQAASVRALTNRVRIDECLQLVKRIRLRHPQLPIGLLVYANLVWHRGLENFYRACRECGIDSVLVADVPLCEARPFIDAAKREQIAPVFIATPNANKEALGKVAKHSEGYTYLLGRVGVTGTHAAAELPLGELLSTLSELGAPPAIQGFGISTPEQVQAVISAGAKGAISGSAVVDIIANNLSDHEQMLDRLDCFCRSMKDATRLIK